MVDRRRRSFLIAVMVLGLAACSEGSGHAERVDVPLTVTMTLRATPKRDYGHSEKCSISFHAVVKNEGLEAVHARDCWAKALDAHGDVVVEAPANIGFPAGGYTEPGHPYQEDGTLPVSISPKKRATVSSLSATCTAYVWHGTVPI